MKKKICEKNKKNKAEIIDLLKTVKESCEEGQDGRWDCSTDEGKEGFDAMAEALDRAIELIHKVK